MKTSKSKKLKKAHMDLIKSSSNKISAIDGLNMVPESSIWLANFPSPATRRKYAEAVKVFAQFVGIKKEADLKKIKPVHVIAWRDELIKNKASNQTVNAKLSALSSMYKHLCEKQIVKDNPVRGVKRKNVSKKQVRTQIITTHQVRQMLDAPDQKTMSGLRDAVILHIFFYTGCRIAEIGKLKVKDYYIDGGYRVLNFTIKGDKRNVVAINQELKNIINKYLKKQEHGEEAESPLILAIKQTELRRHLTPKQINFIFHKYAKMVGLPKGVTPHTPRATFITHALERGVDIRYVQNTAGHSDISTTRMYDKSALKHRNSASLAVQF